ncbi:MAG: hypothetical protein RMM08_06525 [Armatimonadota bacterium]|nr:hypothetical protein [bacterium]MDW8320997.1 hypothetical protein [Armatimonadota bacterium]
MKTHTAIEAQVKTLEAQIAALKALLKAKTSRRHEVKTLGDLRGILKGKVHSTEEDIQKAHFHFKQDGEEGDSS